MIKLLFVYLFIFFFFFCSAKVNLLKPVKKNHFRDGDHKIAQVVTGLGLVIKKVKKKKQKGKEKCRRLQKRNFKTYFFFLLFWFCFPSVVWLFFHFNFFFFLSSLKIYLMVIVYTLLLKACCLFGLLYLWAAAKLHFFFVKHFPNQLGHNVTVPNSIVELPDASRNVILESISEVNSDVFFCKKIQLALHSRHEWFVFTIFFLLKKLTLWLKELNLLQVHSKAFLN